MPAETINVFGKPMNKNIVLFGGAAAVGLVGYAWFKSGQEPEGLPAGALPEPVPEPTDVPGFTVLGGQAPPITNNGEWTELAVERMANIGIDPVAASQAIGKFLARKPLTVAEQGLVQQALAHAGPPPVDGPFTIIPETTPGAITPTKPGAITGLRAVGPSSGSHFLIVWDTTPGATGYVVKGYSHGSRVWGPEWPETQNRHQAYLGPGHYSYYVKAVNAAGDGPWSTAVEFDKQ